MHQETLRDCEKESSDFASDLLPLLLKVQVSSSAASTLYMLTCMQRKVLGHLPIVPQVHCTFLDLAEDFKAALQLCPGAVGPQSPHIHHPSLLLLVKGEDRAEEGD